LNEAKKTFEGTQVFPPNKKGEIKMEIIFNCQKTAEEMQAEYDEKAKKYKEEDQD
jgi:hypothetical protein